MYMPAHVVLVMNGFILTILILLQFLSQVGLYALGKLSVRKQSEFVLIYFFMVRAYYYSLF
jgi:hypothetical protein